MQYLPAILIIAIVLYVFAFYNYRNKQYIAALVCIIAAGFIIRLFCSLDFYIHEWDERFHILVAKNLLSHPLTPSLFDKPVLPFDPNDWTRNHIWFSKPPLTFWLMAPFIKLFGRNEFAVRTPSLLLSTAMIYITWLLAKELFNKRVAVISAFLMSIHGMLIESAAGIASSDHVDTLFLFNVELSILFLVYYLRRNNKSYFFLSVLCAALAFYSKWIAAFMLFPVIIIMLLYHFGGIKGAVKSALWLASFFVLSLPIPFILWQLHPQEFNAFITEIFKPIGNVVQGHDGPWYYYIQQAGILFNELIYLPLLFVFYYWLRGRKNISRVLILSWILLPLLLFTLSSTKRNTYALFCAPPFFILSAYFLVSLPFLLKKYPARKYLYPLVGTCYLILSVRYGIERIKPFKDKNPAWSQEIKSIATTLPHDRCVVFNVNHNIELMFYSDATVYDFIPVDSTINRLRQEGYKLYVANKPGTIKDENKTGINYILLPHDR